MKESKNQHSTKVSWEALTYFNFYHFLISFLFVSLFWIGQLPEPLGEYDSQLFGITAHIYLFISIAAQLLVRLKSPPYVLQVGTSVFIDIIIITIMMYASAGLNSGFGMLLVIAVAGGSLLSSGKTGILYAAVTTIMVLGHEAYMHLQQIGVTPNYTHAGFLGITFFATAIISHALAKRVEVSEALAEERADDLEKLAILNEHIVQRLQSGIVVLDDSFSVVLVNESARQLLGIDADSTFSTLSEISAELDLRAREWLELTGRHSTIIKLGNENLDIQASFTRIKLERKFEVLIFLEDMSTIRQRAQHLKLASLGRLTASIAHEIRNPLGAISHAGQLLFESESISDENRRLTTIISDQSKRVNNIIENVMSISRREKATPTVVKLDEFLEKFSQELRTRHQLQADDVQIIVKTTNIYVNMDPSQLHQVLWNLSENGIRYSKNSPLLVIYCDIVKATQRPYIDIIDCGSGMEKNVEEQLFEPFFTTSAGGSGLGLYIARELCEANQATLNLHSNTESGCCFRIYFSHHEKQHTII
ncbi:MAG: PAS domain-containing protein [Gammaproteobacteria bacterium]|nr:PAS domain-containing protein [Gammaproteobacteria bacterium]